MKKYRCTVCEWIYDPLIGDPEGGIAHGTPFEDLPDRFGWVCPVCGEGKEMFEEIYTPESQQVYPQPTDSH